MSSQQSTAQAAAASAALNLQQKESEKEQARRRRREAESRNQRERDPFLFPFEDYFFAEVKAGAPIERALALPPGDTTSLSAPSIAAG